MSKEKPNLDVTEREWQAHAIIQKFGPSRHWRCEHNKVLRTDKTIWVCSNVQREFPDKRVIFPAP